MKYALEALQEKEDSEMKKGLIFTFVLMMLTVAVCNAQSREVLNTDIRAYIDGYPIRSFNIEGWTGIVAEDLASYGFDVTWDGVARTLRVEKSIAANAASTYRFEENTAPVGSHAAYIYETDIRTFVDKSPVTAFNIGGQTIIYIDELAVFGNVVWDGNKREISYSGTEPWHIGFELPDAAEHAGDDGIDKISVDIAKDESGKFYASGEGAEHLSWMSVSQNKDYGLQLGFSMAAQHLFADTEFVELCNNICTVDYDGARLREDAVLANMHAEVSINGQGVKITNVRKEKGNNHLDFIFELASNVKKEEIEKISFECGINKEE